MSFTVRVLGARTPYPTRDEPCSGYLVETTSAAVLVELGLSVWPELLQHADPRDLAAVWVSHLHPDHCGDLFAAYQWAANTKGAPRIPIYGPTGWADRIGAALPVSDGPDMFRQLFEVREHTQAPEQLRDLTLTAVPVRHSVPTFGLRLTHDDMTFAFSGDSGPTPALSALASNAEIFLCESGAAERGEPYHCAPEDAAHAGRAARQLVITHLAPGLAASDASRRAGGALVARRGVVVAT